MAVLLTMEMYVERSLLRPSLGADMLMAANTFSSELSKGAAEYSNPSSISSLSIA